MTMDSDACYRALEARDPRFDGLFFVGVSSTGVYCRTVCPAKLPKRENCSFYVSAAAAESAGYRPCLRCRPEMAPGKAHVDAVSARARQAARRIEEGALSDGHLSDLASDLGISARHLRRAMREELGVSPVALAQTQKLLTAKQLLTDTQLSIGEIAFASGFSSLRRFNSLFQSRYGMSPGALRKSGRASGQADLISCDLGYRPPFDWDSLLGYLGPRAARGVEAVVDGTYVRTVSLRGHSGWIRVSKHSSKAALHVEVSSELGPVLPALLTRVKRLFDLSAEPEKISQALGSLGQEHPGLRMPGCFDGFEVLVRAVVGQQISVRLATELIGRFVQALGEPIATPFPELNRLYPSPAVIAETPVDPIGSLGIIGVRARAIIEAARLLASKELVLGPGSDLETTRAKLLSVKGIGPWTAEYVIMRALSWPDAFPHGDLGLRKALDNISAQEALALAEQWRPWRSYAAAHLWKSLEKRS